MAVVTLDIPIALAEGSQTIEVVLESGFSLRLVGGVAVAGSELVVAAPADYANVTFPLPVSGACAPYDSVRIYNDDTGELIGNVAADALGTWSISLPSA